MQADYHREEIQRILAGGFDMNLKPEELVKALAEMEGKKDG